jgi:hypothetical protein
VAETAFAIFGEVAVVDGSSVELFLETGLDFGEAVEPRQDGIGGFSVSEAKVELFADVERETGDFAEHGRKRVNGVME